jgi:ubiquinone/menaquinone biosynthesis C-methylase UbiE
MVDNIQFYNDNAKFYVNSIENADISKQLQSFLKHIPSGGKILDGGCGTGRDSLYMLKQGYNVTAFDASEKMADIAAKNTGLDVSVITFEEIELPKNYFDGIWCMSSLLHVHRNDMSDVLNKLYNSLKYGGYFYCTYKFRSFDFEEGGRYFTCYNEQGFRDLIKETKFNIENITVVSDPRPCRSNEKWFCVLLKKPDEINFK